MVRRAGAAPSNQRGSELRVNDGIDVDRVHLIDTEGKNHGIVLRDYALESAQRAGLDLVEVAPNSDPPICKIMNYGKYKYQERKKANEARKKQKTIDVKEIKLRPNIDSHDYDVKARAMKKFFENGDKVKVTLRFRGREMVHQHLGHALLERLRDEMEEIAKVESEPRMEGRQIVMMLSPR